MSLINEIKGDLFTLRGLGVTAVTNLILAGALAAYVFVRVEVLGEDVALSVPSRATIAKR